MGVVVPIRRRAAGMGAVEVAKVDPLASTATPADLATYRAREAAATARGLECESHRQILGIGAGIGLSLGLTAIFASKSPALRMVGAAAAGAGALAGAGAVYSHMRIGAFNTERDALRKELAKFTPPAGK